jgi:Spy/CpxP family protein refolding chaperone
MPPGRPGFEMRGPAGPGVMPGRPEMRPRDSMPDLLNPEVQKELAITAEQRQKLADIRFNVEKESIQHRSALQIQRLELSRLIGFDNPDRTAVDKKIQEIAQEEAALMRSTINARLNTRAALTAEQRAKLEQLRQRRMGAPRPQPEGPITPGRPSAKRERVPLPAVPAKPPAE